MSRPSDTIKNIIVIILCYGLLAWLFISSLKRTRAVKNLPPIDFNAFPSPRDQRYSKFVPPQMDEVPRHD